MPTGIQRSLGENGCINHLATSDYDVKTFSEAKSKTLTKKWCVRTDLTRSEATKSLSVTKATVGESPLKCEALACRKASGANAKNIFRGKIKDFDKKNGAFARTRTVDPVIKSHLLYRLSYERTCYDVT